VKKVEKVGEVKKATTGVTESEVKEV